LCHRHRFRARIAGFRQTGCPRGILVGLGCCRLERGIVPRLFRGNGWGLRDLVAAFCGPRGGPVGEDGHDDQFPQRPFQIAPRDPDGLVVHADLVDGLASLRPVRRRLVQRRLLDQVPAPAGVTVPGGIEHPAPDAAAPGHLGDHDPHLGQSVLICQI
jgi:hypothetical protein